MNMGGPGDHWHTDIHSWKRAAFGEPVDSLIREISALGGGRLLQDHSFGTRSERRDSQTLESRLSRAWGRADEAELRDLASELSRIRDQLRAEAKASGWEIE